MTTGRASRLKTEIESSSDSERWPETTVGALAWGLPSPGGCVSCTAARSVSWIRHLPLWSWVAWTEPASEHGFAWTCPSARRKVPRPPRRPLTPRLSHRATRSYVPPPPMGTSSGLPDIWGGFWPQRSAPARRGLLLASAVVGTLAAVLVPFHQMGLGLFVVLVVCRRNCSAGVTAPARALHLLQRSPGVRAHHDGRGSGR